MLKLISISTFLIACVAGLASLSGFDDARQVPPKADAGHAVPRTARVAVLVLENRSYEDVIGSAEAPYINRLARRYALATHYYAIGHPSLPNYIALTGGSTFGITDDCGTCRVSARNLVGQLADAGHSWRAYFEHLDSNRWPGPVTPEYNPHYNPFVYFDKLLDVPSARRRIVGFDDLSDDMSQKRLPEFSWIAPDVHEDGHNGTLAAADSYASQLVPRVLRALGPNGVLYLTWDESLDSDTRGVAGPGGGRIALIAAGDGARRGARTSVRANHYALLRTIEAGFGLRALGEAGADSTPVLKGLLD
jgi:phosphatidylinositol-3-phosphatase